MAELTEPKDRTPKNPGSTDIRAGPAPVFRPRGPTRPSSLASRTLEGDFETCLERNGQDNEKLRHQTGRSEEKTDNFRLLKPGIPNDAPGIRERQPIDNNPKNIQTQDTHIAGKTHQVFDSTSDSPGQKIPGNNPPDDIKMQTDDDDDGFIEVKSRKKTSKATPDLVKKKQYLFGVNIKRIRQGSSQISESDIRNLFQLISHLDPNAVIVGADKKMDTAQWAAVLGATTRMDYTTLLDLKTTNWGRAIDGLKRTTFSFWCASDIIPSVAKLRQADKIQAYLAAGKCTMSVTYLHESRAKVVAYLQGKSPIHTNRDIMTTRLANHIHQVSPDAHSIPIHVAVFNELGVNILGILVGQSDYSAVDKILKDNPFPHIQLIHHSWKRSHRDLFQQRLKEHEILVANSRAYKVVSMDPTVMDSFADDIMNSTSSEAIIDVCQAAHSEDTGTIYVQYLLGHEQTTMETIKYYMPENPEHTTFKDNPYVANTGGEDAQTVQSRTTAQTTGTKLPVSKWSQIVQGLTSPSKPSVPRDITTSSFSTNLMQSLRGSTGTVDEVDDSSTVTQQTDNTSKKSVREIELELENSNLKSKLDTLQKSHEQMQQTQALLLQQVAQLNEMLKNLQPAQAKTTQIEATQTPVSQKRHKPSTTPINTPTKPLPRPPTGPPPHPQPESLNANLLQNQEHPGATTI